VETIQDLPAWYQDLFIHWYGSVHGEKGITCDQCHGGDPQQSKKSKAHLGVLSSKKLKSPIYFKNIPETCGSCHSGVFQEFKKGLHYQNLKKDRLAPTCTTCHGFQMDIQAVIPLRIVGRCTICHNIDQKIKPEVPDIAKQALAESEKARKKIELAQFMIDLGKEEGRELKEAKALLEDSRGRLKKSGELWHRFHLDEFKKELDAIQNLADKAYKLARSAIFEG
jgi:formate-dependent nitrite reductase cytochrome c552 subunit